MTAGEEPIASAQSYATDRVFGDVVIGFEPGVCGKAGQRGAASDDVAQGLGEFRSCRKLSLSILCPDEERIEQGSDSGAMLQPLGGRGEAGLVLDGVELGDPIERRFGDGRLGGLLSESLAQSLWEQLDEPTRRAAIEILARLIARMVVAAANEASHD